MSMLVSEIIESFFKGQDLSVVDITTPKQQLVIGFSNTYCSSLYALRYIYTFSELKPVMQLPARVSFPLSSAARDSTLQTVGRCQFRILDPSTSRTLFATQSICMVAMKAFNVVCQLSSKTHHWKFCRADLKILREFFQRYILLMLTEKYRINRAILIMQGLQETKLLFTTHQS